MVDTGSNCGVVFHKWLFDASLAEGQLKLDEGISTIETVAGSRSLRRGWLTTLTCGEYRHEGLLVEEGSANVLGLEYFARFAVTIDVSGGRIYLSPGEHFNRQDSVNRTGLEVNKINGVVEVALVKKGTPADMAGMLLGDKIVAINGTRCYQVRLMEFEQRLCDSAGKKLALTIDRQGTQTEVTLDIPDAISRQGTRSP